MIVPKVVITGGPCGGKSTAMAHTAAYLKSKGIRVFLAQEAATALFLGGAQVSDLANPACQVAFQHFVLRFQRIVEDQLVEYAMATGEPSIVLCDRGFLDGAAYMNRDDFIAMLHAEGTNEIEARDCRYDAVIHMTTAAKGAAEHYTLENNAARSENVTEAIVQDDKTMAAWIGHPHHVIVQSTASFQHKLRQVELFLAKLLLLDLSSESTKGEILHYNQMAIIPCPKLPRRAYSSKSFQVSLVGTQLNRMLPLVNRDFHINSNLNLNRIELMHRSSSGSSFWIQFYCNSVLTASRLLSRGLYEEYLSAAEGEESSHDSVVVILDGISFAINEYMDKKRSERVYYIEYYAEVDLRAKIELEDCSC